MKLAKTVKSLLIATGFIITALGAVSGATSGVGHAAEAPCDKKSFFGKLTGFLNRTEKEPKATEVTQEAQASHVSSPASSLSLSMANVMHRAAAEGLVIDPQVKALGLMPRGSAVATSAGALEAQGITQIIHAASGSAEHSGPKFDPSLDGVVNSVKNSIELARLNGHRRVAVPFIGGKIFVDRIGIPTQELANQIVDSALRARGDLELRFVTFGEEDTALFRKALKRHENEVSRDLAQVNSGSITDFKVHGASAIINAANMEIRFGGGLSGVIGRATGRSAEIDQEAQKAIREFYQTH